ncbi:hypothetical protein F4604DRAFT_1759199 [Suillus subluteus]|nr:hypothetical protein F4604DRAFT_1759199 [Suillus subluteus]
MPIPTPLALLTNLTWHGLVISVSSCILYHSCLGLLSLHCPARFRSVFHALRGCCTAAIVFLLTPDFIYVLARLSRSAMDIDNVVARWF